MSRLGSRPVSTPGPRGRWSRWCPLPSCTRHTLRQTEWRVLSVPRPPRTSGCDLFIPTTDSTGDPPFLGLGCRKTYRKVETTRVRGHRDPCVVDTPESSFPWVLCASHGSDLHPYMGVSVGLVLGESPVPSRTRGFVPQVLPVRSRRRGSTLCTK